MKKILAFGASNSSRSINKQFALYTAQQIPKADITLLDLNDFEMPIYSPDREAKHGMPELARAFKQHIVECDALIVSFAEYNGSYTAAFKNIYDRVSRLSKPIWEDKPTFLLATSPGIRGGRTVLDHAVLTFPHRGSDIVASFALPSFGENFSSEEGTAGTVGITDPELRKEYTKELTKFIESV